MSINDVPYHHCTGGENVIKNAPKIEIFLLLLVTYMQNQNDETRSRKNLLHQNHDKPWPLSKRKYPQRLGFAIIVIEKTGILNADKFKPVKDIFWLIREKFV